MRMNPVLNLLANQCEPKHGAVAHLWQSCIFYVAFLVSNLAEKGKLSDFFFLPFDTRVNAYEYKCTGHIFIMHRLANDRTGIPIMIRISIDLILMINNFMK